MSAILSPPALHKAFAEDKGCKGITTAASPAPAPGPQPATRPAAERRSPGSCGSLARALRPEVVGAVQRAAWQSFSLPLYHALCLETLPGAPFIFSKPLPQGPFAGSSAPAQARSCLESLI